MEYYIKTLPLTKIINFAGLENEVVAEQARERLIQIKKLTA